ncbi:MAG: lysophospholipid acyltransferase family protein [Candidatus Dormibacteria bacterium]
MFSFRVRGRNRVPVGGCLVVANHIAWFDSFFVMAALPLEPPTYIMARRDTVFNRRWKRWLLPRLCVFPVTRNAGALDQEAVEAVLSLLRAGRNVLLFPEGTYGARGQLKPFRRGLGFLALDSGRPVLPVALQMPGRLRFRARIRVEVGRPYMPRRQLRHALQERVDLVVGDVRARLLAMLAQGAAERPRGLRARLHDLVIGRRQD